VKKFIVFTTIRRGFWFLSLYLHPYNLDKGDKPTNIYLNKATIKIKCYNLFRCLQFLYMAPSTKMLPQKPLLHKCRSRWLDCKMECMSMARMGNQWHAVANTLGNIIMHYFMKHPPHGRSLRKKISNP
jgi:hypothetical protein